MPRRAITFGTKSVQTQGGGKHGYTDPCSRYPQVGAADDRTYRKPLRLGGRFCRCLFLVDLLNHETLVHAQAVSKTLAVG